MRKLLFTLMIGATTLALAACQGSGSPSPSLLPSESASPLMPSESASPLMPSESASPLMPSESAS